MPFPKRYFALRRTLLPVLLSFTLAALLPSMTRAVALGEATVRSALGQKLDAAIDITSLSAAEAETLMVRVAPADMFADAGLDYGALQRSLRLSVEKKADRTLIRVNSELPVSDPFLMLLIEVNAAGNRTVRQYALLLDPPSLDEDTRGAAIEPPAISAPPAGEDASSARASEIRNKVSDKTAERKSEPAQTRASPTRVVRRGDTLAKVASEALPPGATLEQSLVAFLHANPGAFDGRNIHRMKAGSVLRVPDDQEIKRTPATEARREVALQTADYQHYRDALARSAARPAQPVADDAASSAMAGNRSSSGKIGVSEPRFNAAEGARDRLKLDSSVPGHAGSEEPQSDPHRELAQIAREKALAEANSRIAELEKNIDQMQQQLAVRNQTLADAQQRSEQAVSGAAPAKPETVPEISADAASSDAKKAKVAKSARNTRAAPAAEDQDIAGYFARLQEQFANDPLLLSGSVATLLVGGLMLALRSRLKKRETPVPKIEPNAEGQSVFGQAGGRNVDTANSVFHSNFVPSVSQLDANEVDAIAEADVYIAYGRDEQAEEILQDALKHHPQRHALRVKLLEIYLARKDTQKFGAVAAELRVMTHGQGQEWGQAAQMGQQLDPGNLLYGGSPVNSSANSTVIAPALTPVPAAVPAASAAVPEAFAHRTTPAAPSVVSAAPGISEVSAPSAASLLQPPLGLVRPDESMSSSSAVEDFGIKLEGLLDERRKDTGMGLSLAPVETPDLPERAPVADFQLSGISPAASEGMDTRSDALALKTKIDLALACQEIGDKEAARELLTEVAGTRHPELASRAQSLLQQLA